MPAFLLPLLSGFFKCKTCLWVAAIGAALLAGWLYVHHLESAAAAAARAACIAEAQKATDAEHRRRVQIERYMQQWATGSIAHVEQMQKQLAAAQVAIAKASAAHDHEPGLTQDAVERLRGIK